jgi:hypothetical protein
MAYQNWWPDWRDYVSRRACAEHQSKTGTLPPGVTNFLDCSVPLTPPETPAHAALAYGALAVVPVGAAFLFGWIVLWIGNGFRREAD